MDFIQFAKNVENAGMAGPEHLTPAICYRNLALPQKGR